MGKQASAKISYPAFNFEGMRIASRRRRIIREMATLKDLANDGKINKKTFEKVRKQLAEELETGEEPLQKGKGR